MLQVRYFDPGQVRSHTGRDICSGYYSEQILSVNPTLSWNSTGEIGRIGRHQAETHRYFNIRFFGQMPADASDFPGGIPALDKLLW